MNNCMNPLMNFARKAELSIKLPSNGKWYDEGMIDYTPNGEVEVYPMLPKDELLLMNPDALLSGQANINMIKSCVPSIKEPEKLLYPDANVLFLAIQKATYGDKITMSTYCPHCHQLIDDNKYSQEDIEKLESENKLMSKSFDIDYSIEELLQQMTYLDEEYIVKLDNGLKIYVSPNTIHDKYMYSNMSLTYKKLLKVYKEMKENNSDDEINDDNLDKESISIKIQDLYNKLTDINNQIIAKCIIKIVLPDDTVVYDKDNIYEFICNCKSDIISELNNKRTDINDIGLPTHLDMECPVCHHSWKDIFYGYNQSDFFGIGSYF